MSIRRWDPISELSTLRDQMNRMWDSVRPVMREPQAPRIDLHQTEDEVIAIAELPGIESKEDIEVELTKEAISLRGEFRRHQDVPDEDYIHSERYIGSFSRTIPLPVEVKPEEAQGSFTNGLLEIRIPKTEAGKQKRSYRVPIA